MRRLAPSLALSLASLAACAGGEAASAGSTARDSAGVAIVESNAPAWPDREGWTIDPEPKMEIGEVDGAPEYQFSNIGSALLTTDGSLVVVDGGSGELRWYDSQGKHVRSAGRKGEGPGEFQNLAAVYRYRGDSLLVWDRRLVRASVFSPAGEFVRSFSPAGLTGMGPAIHGVLTDGSVVGAQGFDPGRVGAMPDGEYRDSVSYLRFSPTGAAADTLAHLPGPEQYVAHADGGFTNGPVLFGRTVAFAVAADGYLAGDNDRFEVARYGRDGVLTRIIRRPHQPVAVTAADVERFHEQSAGTADLSRVPPQMRAYMAKQAERDRSRPHRSVFPAFETLREDVTGHVWVRNQRRPGDERQVWSVFDPEGRWLGEVETPEGLDVKEIGADYVLGVAKDELDVEQVRLHRIVKSPAS